MGTFRHKVSSFQKPLKTSPLRGRAGGAGLVQPEEEKAARGPNKCLQISQGIRRMGPDPFQWSPATGQGTTGTNWSTGSSIWTWGRTSSLWGWWSTGTGCPGRLWSLLLWRYSKPSRTRTCAACSRWPCFGRGVGLDDPQRSLPTPTMLWFCEKAVICSPLHTKYLQHLNRRLLTGELLNIQSHFLL